MRVKILYPIMAVMIGSLASTAYAAPAKRFPPKDECLHIDGYFELRQKFESIVQRRDSKALLAMVNADTKWSFGGEEGTQTFASKWKMETGKTSPIWAELDKILRLGCTNEGKYVTMPHFFAQDIPGKQGIGSTALVLGPEVKLRTGPSTSTAIKAVINWEAVELGEKDPSGAWTAVKTTDGKSGYIRNDYLRNQTDYRIGFERKAAGWQISYFIAGD